MLVLVSGTNRGERGDLIISTRIVEMLASGVGAGIGYATQSPEGLMAGAVLAPAAALAWEVDRAARNRRLHRAATALVVSTEGGIPIAELEERSQRDPDTAELLARVVQVAADARMAEKVSAMGRLLRQAIVDQTRFDEAFLLAAALEDLEAPHVKLLALVNGALGTEWNRPGSGRVSSLEHLASRAGEALVLPAVAAALVRHGLIEMVEGAASLNRRLQLIAASLDAGASTKDQWATTELGHRCLTLVLPEAPPWAGPRSPQPTPSS
jgi:hypothetical protein